MSDRKNYFYELFSTNQYIPWLAKHDGEAIENLKRIHGADLKLIWDTVRGEPGNIIWDAEDNPEEKPVGYFKRYHYTLFSAVGFATYVAKHDATAIEALKRVHGDDLASIWNSAAGEPKDVIWRQEKKPEPVSVSDVDPRRKDSETFTVKVLVGGYDTYESRRKKPVLATICVECTRAEYMEGKHYVAAENHADLTWGLTGPFWSCDENDSPMISKLEWDRARSIRVTG